MIELSLRRRVAILIGPLVAGLLALAAFTPVPQNLDYHLFADGRSLFVIPHFGDVVSNAGFALVGLLGILTVAGRKRRDIFAQRSDAWPYLVFFFGVALVSLGSAYYHWAPSNDRLLWDRLPMSIAFMAFFSAVIADRIDSKAGNTWLLLVLVGDGLVPQAERGLHQHPVAPREIDDLHLREVGVGHRDHGAVDAANPGRAQADLLDRAHLVAEQAELPDPDRLVGEQDETTDDVREGLPGRFAGYGHGTDQHQRREDPQPGSDVTVSCYCARCIWQLEVFATKRRDRKAALAFLKRYSSPRIIVTDRLRSYGAAMKDVGLERRPVCGRWLNNRAEFNHLNTDRHLNRRDILKQSRSAALVAWRELAA